MDFPRPQKDMISEIYLYKMASIAKLKMLARHLYCKERYDMSSQIIIAAGGKQILMMVVSCPKAP